MRILEITKHMMLDLQLSSKMLVSSLLHPDILPISNPPPRTTHSCPLTQTRHTEICISSESILMQETATAIGTRIANILL